MAGKNTAVFGIFKSRTDLENAVDNLRAEGFRNTDISVLFPDNQGTKDFAHEKHTKAPEGTATGAGTGAAVGGVLGWLTGIGALAIPGIGPFIAAGPIMAALAGMGVGGVVGGIAGALIGMGIPEYEAKRYEGRVREGGILLSVHSDRSEETNIAKDILKRTGATDISSANEASSDKSEKSSRTKEYDMDRPSSMDKPKPATDAPVIEEETRIRRTRNVRSDPNFRDPDIQDPNYRDPNLRDPNYRPDRNRPLDPDRPVDPDVPPDADSDLP